MAGNRFPSDHMAGRPGAELGIRGSAKRSLWPTRISLLKVPKATNTVSASFPSAACGFRPGGEPQQMPTTTRPSRVTRRAKPVPKEKRRAAHRRVPSLAAPRLPQLGSARRHLRRPPGARPRQTAPEGKDAGTGFANLGQLREIRSWRQRPLRRTLRTQCTAASRPARRSPSSWSPLTHRRTPSSAGSAAPSGSTPSTTKAFARRRRIRSAFPPRRCSPPSTRPR